MITWTAAHPRSSKYAGPPVCCTYCAYEVDGGRVHSARVPRIPSATRLVQTAKGPRELCAVHAGALAP